MAKDDFFEEEKTVDENQPQEQSQQEELIKLGDKEYSQEQLQKLVGLGEIGEELEEKWKTKIDRVYPEFTKARQEVEYWKAQASQRQEEETQRKINQGQQLTQEEIKKQALQQAAELGLMSRDETISTIQNFIQGYTLLNDVNNHLTQMEEDGNPATTSEALLAYMDENGVKDPKKAYKLMFEDELDKIREQKIKSLKPEGLYTQSQSSAGGKQPEPIKVTKDNLEDVLRAQLRGGGQ